MSRPAGFGDIAVGQGRIRLAPGEDRGHLYPLTDMDATSIVAESALTEVGEQS
jgi:hypothetical protein